jgi:hypothetical protein
VKPLAISVIGESVGHDPQTGKRVILVHHYALDAEIDECTDEIPVDVQLFEARFNKAAILGYLLLCGGTPAAAVVAWAYGQVIVGLVAAFLVLGGGAALLVADHRLFQRGVLLRIQPQSTITPATQASVATSKGSYGSGGAIAYSR